MNKFCALLFLCSFNFANEFVKNVTSTSNIGVISLNGDVNVTTNFITIKDNGVELPRGTTSGLQNQIRVWELESNIYMHYFYRRTSILVNLRSDMDMGVMGGNVHDLTLRRAHMEFNAIRGKDVRLDVMIGRAVASDLFESKVMFWDLTQMNGAFFDSHYFPTEKFNLGIKGAGIVYNFADSHYSFIAEFNINALNAKGPYFKYTFVNWRKKGITTIRNLAGNPENNSGVAYGRTRDNPRYRFQISQFVLGYLAEWKTTPVHFSGGFVWNHAAKRLPLFNNKKKNIAWYVDCNIGHIDKKNSYTIEFTYEYVQAQAVPDWDWAGIGNGNPRLNMIYGPATDDFTGLDVVTTTANANGNVNYKGFEIDFKYAITNNIQAELAFSYTLNQDRDIGPYRRYHNLGLTLHYYW